MRGLTAPGVVKKLSNILRKQHFDADVSDAEDPPRQFGQCPKERVFFPSDFQFLVVMCTSNKNLLNKIFRYWLSVSHMFQI